MRRASRSAKLAMILMLVGTLLGSGCSSRAAAPAEPRTLWSVKTSLGPVSAVAVTRNQVVAFSSEGGSVASVDMSGTPRWERTWEQWSLTEMVASDDGRLCVVSRAAEAFSLESPTPHVTTALDASGETLWETTMTIAGGGAVGLKITPTASRVMLIPYFNAEPPAETSGSYQLRDGMSGALMYEPARATGSIVRVDATSDLSEQYVGSVVSPEGEGPGSGYLEIHDSNTMTYATEDSLGDIMGIPSPDGHWYLDVRNHQTVVLRDAVSHSAVSSTTVEYVGDARFSADGERYLLVNYRSALTGAAEETLTGLTLVESATGRVLWERDIAGGGFFMPAANESLSRLVLTSDNPADAPVVFLSLTPDTEPTALPVSASAAAFVDDRHIVVGDANGTLTMLELP